MPAQRKTSSSESLLESGMPRDSRLESGIPKDSRLESGTPCDSLRKSGTPSDSLLESREFPSGAVVRYASKPTWQDKVDRRSFAAAISRAKAVRRCGGTLTHEHDSETAFRATRGSLTKSESKLVLRLSLVTRVLGGGGAGGTDGAAAFVGPSWVVRSGIDSLLRR